MTKTLTSLPRRHLLAGAASALTAAGLTSYPGWAAAQSVAPKALPRLRRLEGRQQRHRAQRHHH